MFIDQLARDQDPNEDQDYWIGLYKNVEGNKIIVIYICYSALIIKFNGI